MEKIDLEKTSNIISRPPVVVILGHVDHGKTTLLDYIRKSNIAEKEPGQITQNIGAFQIEFENKFFTFIDTPGHEAFRDARACGLLAADIAILLVAGDEGVKEQTIEIYNQIKNYNLPFLVAINKIDKKESQIDKVKKQLAEIGIILDIWGGDVPCAEISAKTGKGVKDMLEITDLMAQMHNISADKNKNGSGIVISSFVNSLDGISAGIIVKDGILQLRDFIVSPSGINKIVSIQDSFGNQIQEIPPSMPAKISCLKYKLFIGEKFVSVKSAEEAQKIFENIKKDYRQQNIEKNIYALSQTSQNQKNTLFLIIKAREQNQLNAILSSIEKFVNPYVSIKVIRASLGDISSLDIEEAMLFKAEVLGFQVKIPSQVKLKGRNLNIYIASFDVIYDLLQAIKEKIIEKLPVKITKEIIGSMQILKVFRDSKDKILFGGKVIEGKVMRGAFYELDSKEVMSTKGKIIGLQQEKIDVEEVLKGRLCGISGEGLVNLREGQIINIFIEKQEKPTI